MKIYIIAYLTLSLLFIGCSKDDDDDIGRTDYPTDIAGSVWIQEKGDITYQLHFIQKVTYVFSKQEIEKEEEVIYKSVYILKTNGVIIFKDDDPNLFFKGELVDKTTLKIEIDGIGYKFTRK